MDSTDWLINQISKWLRYNSWIKWKYGACSLIAVIIRFSVWVKLQMPSVWIVKVKESLYWEIIEFNKRDIYLCI